MLPILLSIPHAVTRVPPEVAGRVALSAEDIFDESDAVTDQIYDLGPEAVRVVRAEIARVFVDPNRAPDDRPPANPDGVVKSTTVNLRRVYFEGREPDDELVETLLARYHAPYHKQLEVAAADPEVRLGIDCHSMSAQPPAIAPDPGRSRPLFCLSNADGLTAPAPLLEQLASALAEAFECEPGDIALNEPFKGGYIVRRRYGSVPWIQIEMNRSLYLDPRWFDREALEVDRERLAELRERFLSASRMLEL